MNSLRSLWDAMGTAILVAACLWGLIGFLTFGLVAVYDLIFILGHSEVPAVIYKSIVLSGILWMMFTIVLVFAGHESVRRIRTALANRKAD